MGLFGKKKEKEASEPQIPGEIGPPGGMPASSPTEAVASMKQQGLTNNQIIQELQGQGYNPQQIFDAINKVDPANVPAGPVDMGAAPQGEVPYPGESNEGMPPPVSSSGFDENKEKIEEMAEAIIDEKWEELVKSINKIVEWKEKIEGNINKIEQEIKDMKESYNHLHSSIIGKINEYDKNIVNVGTEVKAMEKVFEKVLPSFTENIGELKRIVKSAKK